MLFGYQKEELKTRNAIFTAEEIAQQPDVWQKTIAQVRGVRGPLSSFIDNATAGECDIILTGAGTSEYVGRCLYPALLQKLSGRVHAIGTTDIVATPELFVSPERKTLLVSFARSGNSPESVGAVKAAERISGKVSHLFITCNEEGALAKLAAEKANCFSLVLAPETNDRSFAMTSSFTCMYIAALVALSGEYGMDFYETVSSAEKFLAVSHKELAEFVAENDMNKMTTNDFYPEGFAGKRDEFMVELFYATGMRLSELINLKHLDFLPAERQVKVFGKRSKERICPLNDYIINRYNEYLEQKKEQGFDVSSQAWLLVTDRGGKLYDKFV